MRRLFAHWFGVMILCFFSQLAIAQEDTASFDSDKLYAVGRELAFNGQHTQARKWLNAALVKSPGYLEIKIFLARTYAWDKQRDTALVLLDEVLAVAPKNLEATYAKCDVLYWDENYVGALDFADKQLKYYATDQQLLIKKAKALIALGFNTEAANLLEQVLQLNPNNEEAKTLLESIKADQLKNNASISYTIDHFGKLLGNAHYQFLQYGRRTKYGSLIGRVNTSQRFDTSGIQPEIDFYPTLGKGFYAYLNYGISTRTPLYPRHRFGAELFKKLPQRFEVSLGGRYLYFEKSNVIRIYTTSLGWYVGNWWLNGRVFITPNFDANVFGKSYNLLARRYFKDALNFVGVYGSVGYSPDLFLQAGNGIVSDLATNIYFLKSHRFGIEAQKSFAQRFAVGARTSWSDLELVFDKGNFVNIWTGQVYVSYRF